MLTLSQDIAQHLGDDPFSDLMLMQGEVFRKQPKRETLRVYIGNAPYFIKKHEGGTLSEYLKNILTGKMPIIGASQEVKAIQIVTALGIPTTPLVGHGVRGYSPLTQQSFILTRALEKTISLETYCEAWAVATPDFNTKRSIIAEVARIARVLHEHHCYHRDFYLCHFLMQLTADKKLDTTQPIVLHLIDLHRMHQSKQASLRWQEKDLSALLFSALDTKLSCRDVLRFMKIYTGLPVRHILARRFEWQGTLRKARELYFKSQGDMPKQRWMHEPGDILPHQAGPMTNPIELRVGHFRPQRALRVLPRQRWVLRGDYQGQDCVAKIFADKADYHQECQGYEALVKANIPCPKRLRLTQTKYGRYLVMYDYVDAHNPAELSEKLIDMMAKMHEAGVSQTDCHLDNFLVDASGDITVCDLGAVRSRDLRPYSERASLENLALLFAQCSPLADRDNAALFDRYVQVRRWPLNEDIKLRFWKQVEAQRQYRRRKWLEKITRTCTAFKCKWRLTHRVCIRRDFANLYSQTLVEHPAAYFNPHANYLKQGGGSTVVRTRLGENDVVIKRYNIKNNMVYLKRLLTGSKAARAWRMSHAIQTLGIHTPEPLAMIEKRFIMLPRESYFVARWVPGERLDYYLENHRDADIKTIARHLYALMEALRLGHCYHGDLKASNIIWNGDKITLLDCDGARFIQQPAVFAKAHERDWKRLQANWPPSYALSCALEKYHAS